MKKIQTIFFSVIMGICVLALPLVVSAQATVGPSTPPAPSNPAIGVRIENPFNCGGRGGGCNLITFVTVVLNNIVMPIAAVAVTLYIIWAGFMFVTAQGKPAELEKAKANLLWALIGAGILLGAAAISKVVETTVKGLIS